MNGTTLAAVRKLKDGQNTYLWQPSLQAGQPGAGGMERMDGFVAGDKPPSMVGGNEGGRP